MPQGRCVNDTQILMLSCFGSHANSHLRRTLSVGVDEPYVTASEPPRNGNIDCNRGFAYSALRIANSDNHLNPFLILKKIFDKWVDTREGRKCFTLVLSISLHKKLKIAAAKREETMAEIICGILEEQLRETD